MRLKRVTFKRGKEPISDLAEVAAIDCVIGFHGWVSFFEFVNDAGHISWSAAR